MNFPRLVGLLGELDGLLPDRAGDLRRHERLDRRPAHQDLDAVDEDPLHLFRRVGLHDERLRGGQLADRRLGIVRQLDHADVLGVVGDARPVERRDDLDLVPCRVLDGFALEVLVGVSGIGDAVPEQPGVERPARVDVGLAEVGVALRVPLRQGRRGGKNRRRRERNASHSMPASVHRLLLTVKGERTTDSDARRCHSTHYPSGSSPPRSITKGALHIVAPTSSSAPAGCRTARSPGSGRRERPWSARTAASRSAPPEPRAASSARSGWRSRARRS